MKFGKQNNGFALLSFDKAQDKRGFTLLELLIVIAIIAVLSAILIFVLNPAETLRKGRDSERISDLATINRALAFYITTSFNPDLDGDGTRGVCGTNVFAARNNASAITDTEIAEKTLKTTAPTGDSNSPANDGSGWIPINLASLTGGSPISRFPLDPSYRVANVGAVTDDDLLYLYGCDTDTTYELNANLESSQFKSGGSDDRESTDGGNNSNVLEVGTKLTILGTSGSGGGGGETTITVKVASPNDDARKDDIGFDLNHQRYSAGEGPTNSGARFVSVGIPTVLRWLKHTSNLLQDLPGKIHLVQEYEASILVMLMHFLQKQITTAGSLV